MNLDNTECDYFRFLKKINFPTDIEIGSDINLDCKNSVKSMDFYKICAFRTNVCELFYNAINFFPEIKEYSIICSTGNKSSTIKFGVFGHVQSHDQTSTLVRIESNGSAFCFTRKHIYAFYVANRVVDPDYDIINTLILLLYVNGKEPDTIKTEFVLDKKFINQFFQKKISDFT